MKYYILFFILLKLIPADAQQNKVVKIFDAENYDPIPYVSIRYKNKDLGIYGNSKGIINIKVGALDTIIISCVGYLDRILSNSKITDTIFLSRNPIVLPPVLVRQLHKSDEYVNLIDYPKKVKYFGSFVALEVAIRIEIPKQIDWYRIEKIIFPIKKVNSSRLIRIHIYEANEFMLPGIELLKKDLLINTSNILQKGVIDLNSQNIIVNCPYLFVGIEWIDDIKSNSSGTKVPFSFENKTSLTYFRSIKDKSFKWNPFIIDNKQNDSVLNIVAGLIIQKMK